MIHDERDVRRRRRRMCCEGVQWLKRRVEALHKIGGRALLIALMLSLSASPLEAFVQVKVPSGPVLTKTCGHSRRALQSQPTHAFQPARHPTIPFLPLVETIRQASERTRPIARCPTKYLAFCVLAVWIGGWCFVPRIALAAPENIQQEMRLHSDVHLRPASGGPRQPSVLLAVPGTGGGCEVVAEGILAAEGALASTPPSGRIAGTLLAVVMCAIPLGLPASCFLVAGISVAELAKPVRAALVLTALPFAVWKAAPRVKKLRFNFEEFAKSDFFKIFDFWKLLESALNGGKLLDQGESNAGMPRMTAEREAALPKADPVWVNLNKELWSKKQTMDEMATTIQELENENQRLRDSLATIRSLLEQKAIDVNKSTG